MPPPRFPATLLSSVHLLYVIVPLLKIPPPFLAKPPLIVQFVRLRVPAPLETFPATPPDPTLPFVIVMPEMFTVTLPVTLKIRKSVALFRLTTTREGPAPEMLMFDVMSGSAAARLMVQKIP